MASAMRFSTARQIFDEFPALAADVVSRPQREDPLEFARTLLRSEGPFAAITFTAFILARREAVWWGLQSVRAIDPGVAGHPAFVAADAWVRAPDEERRQTALRLGEDGDKRRPEAWLASAAGYAGGNMAPPGVDPIAMPPELTPVAIKAAIILTVADQPLPEQAAWSESVVEAGLRFAMGEELRIVAPPPPMARPRGERTPPAA